MWTDCVSTADACKQAPAQHVTGQCKEDKMKGRGLPPKQGNTCISPSHCRQLAQDLKNAANGNRM